MHNVYCFICFFTIHPRYISCFMKLYILYVAFLHSYLQIAYCRLIMHLHCKHIYIIPRTLLAGCFLESKSRYIFQIAISTLYNSRKNKKVESIIISSTFRLGSRFEHLHIVHRQMTATEKLLYLYRARCYEKYIYLVVIM
jgi:hypothetical protein